MTTPLAGLSAASNQPLLQKAQLQTGTGGVCTAAVFTVTAALQVYVPNDGRAGIFHVGACSEPTPWPAP